MHNEARNARHRLRQDDIIAAARRCFRQYGFHAASMAHLASEAQLSVGQIYRYFSNKDAIIDEMIKRIIDRRIDDMIGTSSSTHLPRLLAWRQVLNEDDEALMLEVAAEATRNPRVALMMQEADARIFYQACDNIKSEYPNFSDDKIRSCVEVLAVMVEGTSCRRHSPLKASAGTLYPLYQQIHHLLFHSEDS